MFTSVNDTTVCLPARSFEPEAVSESHALDFDSALAELVEFERAADPVIPEAAAEWVVEVEPARVVPRVWTVFLSMLLAIGLIAVTQFGLANRFDLAGCALPRLDQRQFSTPESGPEVRRLVGVDDHGPLSSPAAAEDHLQPADAASVTGRLGRLAQVVVKPGENVVGRQQFRIDRHGRLQ